MTVKTSKETIIKNTIGIIVNNPDQTQKTFNVEIPKGYQVVISGEIGPDDLIWNQKTFIPAPEFHIGQDIGYFCCVVRKATIVRYVSDIRNSIAAVCDTQHPSYADRTPGLHGDEKFIVAVEYGTSKSTDFGLCWDLEDYQIDRLTSLCDLLNKKGG